MNKIFFKKSFLSFLIILYFANPLSSFALPQGGQITSGQGNIHQPDPKSMVINQSSQQLITNWNSFSIGKAESVHFSQPNSNAVALNRVVGANPSAILGSLSSNGKVFLTNRSGIIFGQDARINVGGLVATTLNISDQDFLNQNYLFSQDPNNPLSAIINEGHIEGTTIGLLAPAVYNKGTITANLGSVALASGTEVTLDFAGDGLINFAISEAVEGDVLDDQGNILENRVLNTGIIEADGGRVILSALDAGSVIRNTVNHSGRIRANTLQEKNGEIWLMGGENGITAVTGELDASGNESGDMGGTVHVLGDKVGLFQYAFINVSGVSGGGTALVGGDFQGKGEVPNATQTYVGPNTIIDASALENGDGGKVILWADGTTRYFGNIDSRGGSVSGDGGLVEVSGKENLTFAGFVDAGSTNGSAGALLLDPRILRITDEEFGRPLLEKPIGEISIFSDSRTEFDGGSIENDLSGFQTDPVPDSRDNAELGTEVVSEEALERIGKDTFIHLIADEAIILERLSDNILDLKQTLRKDGEKFLIDGIDGGITPGDQKYPTPSVLFETNEIIFEETNNRITTRGGNIGILISNLDTVVDEDENSVTEGQVLDWKFRDLSFLDNITLDTRGPDRSIEGGQLVLLGQPRGYKRDPGGGGRNCSGPACQARVDSQTTNEPAEQAVQSTRQITKTKSEERQPEKTDPADMIVLLEQETEELDAGGCIEGDQACQGDQ